MIQTRIFVVILILLYSTICKCDPCRFEYPGKGVIDITTLGRTDGTAAYADRVSPRQPDYSMLVLLFVHIVRVYQKF